MSGEIPAGLSAEQFAWLLERAAEAGARRALERLGLHDDAAGRDVRELRDLLEAWRFTRRTAWRALVQILTTAILAALAAGAALKLWPAGQT